MPKQLSRSPEVDTEKCVAMSGGNRFDLVLMAAARSREIRRQNSTSQKFEHLHSIVTALIEFQEGKIGREYIHKIKFNEYDNRVDRRAKYK